MDFHVFLSVSFRWWLNSQKPTRQAPQQISVRQSRFSARTCSAFSHMQAQYQPPSCSLPLSCRSQARGQSKVTPQLLPPHRWEVRLINSWWWSSVTASSKYPTMSLPSGTQLLSRGHLILFVMYRGVLFVSPQRLMGTYPWSYMCSVNVMQCRVPLLHSLFQAGNVVTFHLWFGFFPPRLPALRVSPRDAAKTGPSQSLHLKFLPTDSNHFFIGTNMVSTISITVVFFFGYLVTAY